MERNNYGQYNGKREDYSRRAANRSRDDWRDDEIAGGGYGDWDETGRDLSRASNYTTEGGRNRGEYGNAGAGSWTEEDRSRRQYGSSPYASRNQSYGSGQYGPSQGSGQYYGGSQSTGSDQAYGGGEYYGARRGGYATQQGGGFQSFRPDDYGGADFSSRTYGTPYGGYGSSYTSDAAAAGSYGFASGVGTRASDTSGRSANYGTGHRGFFDRASDEVASWFGDEEAARRREMDHTGRGPSNYSRSDERIREDVCDRLTDDWQVDASEVNVTVDSGEVTLDGTVDSRAAKRRAEDCVERISGVRHVQNNLRVREATRSSSGTMGTGSSTSTLGSTASDNQYSSH